jgi:predicted MPP superfamily phosphohydrolase
MSKRVFVSDIHISPGLSLDDPNRCYDWLSVNQAAQFNAFLKYLIIDNTIQEMIILGDLMDGWVYPIETRPPGYDKIASAGHVIDIMDSLRKLAAEKKVTYVIGNHDMTLMEPQFESFRRNALAGISFRDFYETPDGLYAEHGHQYTMYNAVDPKHELPLGHYISRLAATVAERKQHFYINAELDMKFRTAENYEMDTKGFIRDPLVNAPLTFLENELSNVDDHTPITTVEGGITTLAEIRQRYANLGLDWISKHGLLDGIRSVF